MSSIPSSSSSRLPSRFKKGVQVIMARAEGDDFTLFDRKVVNVLLANAYANMLNGRKLHHIRIQDLATALLMDTDSPRESFNSMIRQSLDRLWSRKITIDYTDQNNVEHTTKCHYISFSLSKIENADLHYAFDEVFMTFLGHPQVYGVIELDVAAKMRSPYALRLYEIMRMIYGRTVPKWELSVAEFREYFEIGDKYDRFDFLRKHVIEKAVEEVNANAEFSVEVDYNRAGRGGKVETMSFRPVSKGMQVLQRGLASPTRQSEDTQTIDLFDGKTVADRRVAPELKSNTVAQAMEIMGGSSEEQVMIQREKWFDDVGVRAHSNPDDMFIWWLKLEMKKRETPSLQGIDVGSLLGRLLDSTE